MEKIFYQGKELLPPRQHLALKAIFGTEKGKGLLAAFLRDVLSMDVEKAEDVTLLNNEIFEEYDGNKQIAPDLRVRTSNNDYINIEIHLAEREDIIPRSMYYHANLVASQESWKKGNPDRSRAISLFILDFILFPEEEVWYNEYKFGCEDGEELTDLSMISFLELPKVRKACQGKEALSASECWGLFLSARDGEVMEMLKKQ
ncbi:MAG: Rpn family recombination-promoting nuclease/putative transposase, partial [Bacillota bacterium]|nr:Rpn family recombination-promoting nuclease/putative transposase [Bacillota bacterium]